METLGRYQILGEIGRGGCGVVYRALDPGIGRIVAIKTILAEPNTPTGAALRERFRREARSGGSLSHPNIVTIHEFNDSGEIMFIAMEFIQGGTLAEKMAEGGPMALDLVLPAVRSAADALDYAHANGIVHRDVKPANFMIAASGQVKVTDFGIAKLMGDDLGLTNTGMVIGTAQYMSPEQIAAKPATGRSDQFSLAVIAYEMLTGQKPFQGNSWASVMHQIMSADPPPVKQHRKDLGDEVTTVLRKALAKDPDGRYASCREFAEDLAEAVMGVTMQRTAGMPIAETMKHPLPPPRPGTKPEALPETEVMPGPGIPPSPARPRSVFAPVAMGIGAAVLLAGGWFWFSAHRSSPAAPAAPTALTPPTPQESAPVAIAPAADNPAKPPAPKQSTRSEPPSRAAAPAVIPVPVPVRPEPAPAAEPAPTPPPNAPAPVATPAATPVITPAAVPIAPPPPAPKPAVVESAPPPPPAATPVRPVEVDDSARRAEESRRAAEAEAARKVAELAAARKAVDGALNRYRVAFENKDPEALKEAWPNLGRAELSSFQNFFKIARSIKLQLRPLGEAEVTSTGAIVRARRSMAATDERGALPQQDQTVKITLRRAAGGMVIESIETLSR